MARGIVVDVGAIAHFANGNFGSSSPPSTKGATRLKIA